MSSRQTEDRQPSPEERPGPAQLVIVASNAEAVEAEDATRPLELPPELAELPIEEEEPTDMFGALSLAPPSESFGINDGTTDHYGVLPLSPITRPRCCEAEDRGDEEVGIDSEHEETIVGPPSVATAVGE
jgi:hypothetical protein